MLEIARRTGPTVRDLHNASAPALRHDFGGEINFVMRRTNAGTELRNDALRL